MSVTLKDVASHAGVSTATVSRVLNDSGTVRRSLREKVLKAIDDLGYQPNAIARSLKQSRTGIIGVIVPDISNPYFMSIIREIERVVSPKYHMLLSSSDDMPEKEVSYLEIFQEQRVDGIVLAPCSKQVSKAIQGFIDRNQPLVFIDRFIEGVLVDEVREESRKGSYELVKHLISLGHKKIAIINSFSASTGIERFNGYKQAMIENGLEIRPEYVQEGQFDEDTGYNSGKKLFFLGDERPTAVFATNNSIMIGLLNAIKEYGYRIPEDISVVSFGELPLSNLMDLQITSVRQSPVRIGELAGRLLMKRLESQESSETPKRIILPTEVKFGRSALPVPVKL